MVFQFLPDNTYAKDYFPLYDIKLTFQTYVYFICEHLTFIVLTYIIASEARKYRQALTVFFYLQVLDLVDYLLTYNTTWFKIGSIPITMNSLSFLIFGLFVWDSYNGKRLI